MDYRKLGKTNVSASLLGFGCMRFPTTKGGEINSAEAEKMLDLAYSKGINYFDTAYVYHSGKSEEFVGKVLSKYEKEQLLYRGQAPAG